jgi:hypothetical protein
VYQKDQQLRPANNDRQPDEVTTLLIADDHLVAELCKCLLEPEFDIADTVVTDVIWFVLPNWSGTPCETLFAA